MKTYDLIVIGTGSAMNLVDPFLRAHPGARVAVIDKDPPGGICLTKGCIPTKMLVYPAELVRLIGEAERLGVRAQAVTVDFAAVMARMRQAVDPEVDSIRRSLQAAEAVDYYPETAVFTAPYQLAVGAARITAPMIFLCLGSRPAVPDIAGLDQVPHYTSDTILGIDRAPRRLAIVGGGYIAAEYGHFFSAMGTEVTIVGRNRQFLPQEEPEVSALAAKLMGRHMHILTGHSVTAAAREAGGRIELTLQTPGGGTGRIQADALLLAAGRQSNADLLDARRGNVAVDGNGWIEVDEHLETTCPNVWALGDATGRHLFKHAANYEARVVYQNAILKQRTAVDYHAVPHAVFAWPEIAAVGMRQAEASAAVGEDHLLVGFHRFRDTAKGEAMGHAEGFVKVLVQRPSGKILGAHVIGPQASLLIQELVTLMYTGEGSVHPILNGMHIHPALSEVVERACSALVPAARYSAP